MGPTTFVKPAPSRLAKPGLKLSGLNLDVPLLVVTVALVIYGLLMVYSASPLPAALMGVSSDYFLIRQILWAVLGAVILLVLTLLDYHLLRRYSIIMLALTLLMLIFVELFGETLLGAGRSIFGASARPSELAKLVTIIYVSVWLDAKKDVLNNITFGLLPLAGLLAIVSFFIVIEPDMSAALTIIILGGLLFFLAGGEWRQLALVIVGTLLLTWLMLKVYPNGARRVSDLIAGLQDPTQASDHIKHSIQAIINGGFFGRGIGQGSAKYIGLPVAHTDSIFAVVAEETGILGSALLIGAYLVILWRGLRIALHAPDNFGRLLAAGLTFWIMLEAFLNIGVMINLFPNAGNALPFISYGGSSLLMMMVSVGILMSINRKIDPQHESGGNPFASVIDLRWRDRRRRVSRPVSPESTR